jgi:hypothetical protein
MPVQLQLTFNAVHRHENNSASQENLELRRDDFDIQCWEALTRMLNGDRIINKDRHIGHMARRALDLITMKGGTVEHPTIPVERDWATDKNGRKLKFKWYYIKPENRLMVAQKIMGMMNQLKINYK